MVGNFSISMSDKIAVHAVLPKTSSENLAIVSHSFELREDHKTNDTGGTKSSSEKSLLLHEVHHGNAVDSPSVVQSNLVITSTSSSFSSVDGDVEKLSSYEIERVSAPHFKEVIRRTTKPFSKSSSCKSNSLDKVRDQNPGAGQQELFKPSQKRFSAPSEGKKSKEFVVSVKSGTCDTCLELISSPSSSPVYSTPMFSSLSSFLDEALKTGFVVRIFSKPIFPLQPRRAIKSGFSMVDWQRKIEMRKKKMSTEIPSRRISQAEIKEHITLSSLWIVVRGVVFDVTDFQYFHPTIDNVLLRCGGRDITSLADSFHPWVNVASFLPTYAVGVLAAEESPTMRNDF